MIETTTVRENLMNEKGYTPYCGNMTPYSHCHNPRSVWNGKQFECPECGWVSSFPEDFIKRYKEKWSK